MRRRALAIAAVVIGLSACQSPTGSPTDPPAAPVIDNTTEETDGSASGDDSPAASTDSTFCNTFDPSTLEWFELGLSSGTSVSTRAGVELTRQQTKLPETSAERYNTIAEVCPGFHLVTTFDGDTALLSVAQNRFAQTAKLTPAGLLENPRDAGVVGGGPVWGFRDSLVVGDHLFFSDAIIDEENQCVAVGVHRIDLHSLIGARASDSELIYRSEPCVSYTDDYRPAAPLKVHLGGALAYSHDDDELYLSIGDFHMGASRISQAEAIGIDNVERDYEVLTDPDAAVSAIVAIATPASAASGRVIAKGLRNSLGMTVVRTNRLWLTDHGPQGGDELNLIEEGADYGWPLTSEGTPYDRTNYSDDAGDLLAPWLDIVQADVPGTTEPARAWSPAIAPTAIVQYPSGQTGVPGWDGDLLVATLRAQSLVHLSLTPEATIVEDRVALGERVRDMLVTDDGTLLMVTDWSLLLVVGP